MTRYKKTGIIITKMQVSPSGMAAASQAVPGEFDSRHLLQKEKHPCGCFSFWTANAVEKIRLLRKITILKKLYINFQNKKRNLPLFVEYILQKDFLQ